MQSAARAVACIILFAAAVPIAVAGNEKEEEDSLGCLNFLVDSYGPGVAVQITTIRAIGVTAMSGKPNEGASVTVLVVPSKCDTQAVTTALGSAQPFDNVAAVGILP